MEGIRIALYDWLTHMGIALGAGVCTSNSLGVRLENKIVLPMEEGPLNFILATEEIRIPVHPDYLSPEDHLMDLEETIWQRGFVKSLVLEETLTWKSLEEVPVEELMNIVLESGFKGFLGTKVLERRLSIC